MKKNLFLMLWLASIILIAGCGLQKVENTNTTGNDVNTPEEISEKDLAEIHPEWVATSLTIKDIEHIEETMPPLSYSYETYDMETDTTVNTGSYKLAEGEEPIFMIPEYATMANREIISSGIEDDMIYTLVKMTLQDDTELEVLYINEPDTLFCRAISVANGNQYTLYNNFVYPADIE